MTDARIGKVLIQYHPPTETFNYGGIDDSVYKERLAGNLDTDCSCIIYERVFNGYLVTFGIYFQTGTCNAAVESASTNGDFLTIELALGFERIANRYS